MILCNNCMQDILDSDSNSTSYHQGCYEEMIANKKKVENVPKSNPYTTRICFWCDKNSLSISKERFYCWNCHCTGDLKVTSEGSVDSPKRMLQDSQKEMIKNLLEKRSALSDKEWDRLSKIAEEFEIL